MIPKNVYKRLTKIRTSRSGRDQSGRISVRHRGGAAKRKLRIVTSLQEKIGKEASVLAIDYDPNRSARLALVRFEDGTHRYILAPENLKINDKVIAEPEAKIQIGNRLCLGHIPTGQQIYDISLEPHRPGQIIRAAGSWATILAQEGNFTHVRLPSGEIRRVNKNCYASIGQLANIRHSSRKIGKAGLSRHMGRRPTVRGKAMHPAAHPHGGGEGVNPIGLKHPKTPWGKPARGVKTRRRKYTNHLIIKSRASLRERKK